MVKGKKINRRQNGMSLLEILVVVAIFSILAIIVTQAIILTLRGSKKSESLLKVRENLGYAVSVIERHLRNADAVEGCPFDAASSISYLDKNGSIASFSCLNLTEDGYIASSSARITGDDVDVNLCSFSCNQPDLSVPPVIEISVAAQDINAINIENAQVDIFTKIQLRTY